MCMRELSVRETQEATLKVLVSFDKICRKINVKYYLIWGTLIGAIRHHGFIPWDDDLDVAMFPEDYLKLEEYFSSQNETELELHNMKTQPDCFYNISRVCEKKYKLVFNNKKYTSGLFVDIYVLYGLGKESDLPYWEKRFKKYQAWQKSVYACCNKSLLMGKNTVHKVLNIPIVLYSKMFGKQYFIKKIEDYPRFEIENSDYLGTPQWEPAVISKQDFDEIQYVEFEGFPAPIPSGYDHLLRSYYGDYMSLPPENERKPHHGYKAYAVEDIEVEKEKR